MLCLFSLSWPSLRVGGLGVEEAHGRGREKRRVRKKKRGKTLPFLRRSSGKRPRASLALTLLTFFRLPKKKTPSRLKTDSFPETGRCLSLLFLCVSQVRPYFSPSPCTKVGAEEELRGRRTEARFYEFAFSLLDARGAPLLRRRSIAPSRRPLTAGLAWPPSLALCPDIFVQGHCVVEMRQLGKKIETLGSFEEHASEGAEDARADRRASSRCSRSLLLLAKKNDASSISLRPFSPLAPSSLFLMTTSQEAPLKHTERIRRPNLKSQCPDSPPSRRHCRLATAAPRAPLRAAAAASTSFSSSSSSAAAGPSTSTASASPAAPPRRSVIASASVSSAIVAAAVAPAPVAGSTPVPKNTMLVVGGTGTLGRQIVRRALDEGYDVRCIVRPRQNPADFLRDWGATTVQADLTDPSSLPAALVGIHTVVDCATARPEESAAVVDWEGKKALIQCAQAMGVQRYLFF